MGAAARRAGVPVAAGDTKVVERGKADGLYVTTAGVGVLEHDLELGPPACARATACSSPERSPTTGWP